MAYSRKADILKINIIISLLLKWQISKLYYLYFNLLHWMFLLSLPQIIPSWLEKEEKIGNENFSFSGVSMVKMNKNVVNVVGKNTIIGKGFFYHMVRKRIWTLSIIYIFKLDNNNYVVKIYY